MSSRVAKGRPARVAAFALAAAAVSLSAAAAQVPAAGKTTPSELNVFATSQIDPGTVVGFGTVITEEERCLANRQVKLIVKSPEGSTVFDLARTSKNGGWLVRGDSSAFIGFTAAVYKLAPRTVEVNGKQLTCGKDKQGVL